MNALNMDLMPYRAEQDGQEDSASRAGLKAMDRDEPTQIVRFNSLEAIACLWINFQQTAQATAYHSYEWATAWQQTVGNKIGAIPRILVGFGSKGTPLFILPLQTRRVAGLKVLEWHGSPDTQYGHGLFSREFLPHAAGWFADNHAELYRQAGDCHLIRLLNMPEQLFGQHHPLRAMFNATAANEGYLLKLDGDFETTYLRKRNSETRRANRRKDSRLAELGELAFRQVTEPAELEHVIETMLRHKIQRLAAEGIHGVFEAADCEMVRRLARSVTNGRRLFSTHVLTLDGTILACTFGGWMNGTYWFYVSSLAPESAATKFSPGDLALRLTIKECCIASCTAFDFGSGSALYKTGWTDEVFRLHSIIRANSLLALPLAVIEVAKLAAKGFIKRHPSLKSLAFNARRLLRAKQAA